MVYQVLYPVATVIDGDSLKNAIKNYIKLSNNINILQMVVADGEKQYRAQMKYYKHDIRNKVGINIYPITNNSVIPIQVASSMPMNINETQVPQSLVIPTEVVATPIISPFSPISPVSPIMPFPSMVRYRS